jgi:hypothetical protein
MGPLRLLGFYPRSSHSRQTLLDGLESAPEVRGLGLQVGPGRARLNHSGCPARNETFGVPPAVEEAKAPSETALETAAAGPETSSISADIGIGTLCLRSAKTKPATGPGPLAPWSSFIVSWHDDTSLE